MTTSPILSSGQPAGVCRKPRGHVARWFGHFKQVLGCLVCLSLGGPPVFAQQTAESDQQAQITALNAAMNQAVEKVKAIVNQPVARYARASGMRVGRFSPGWFHEGAIRPDFDAVDVRQTQEFPYTRYQYVTSDLNPGVVFASAQLEFNPMTKYFYADRSLPKKKLSEAEMLEINRLYRIIGRCERQLAELDNPQAPRPEPEEAPTESARKYESVPKANYVKAAVAISILLVLYYIYRRFR